MDRILINKSNNLLRVARTYGQKLYDLEIENANITQNIDSICNAEVISIEPSLNAAFANFGAKRNGFLPLKEIAPEYYSEKVKSQDRRPNIKDLLFEGQKILVQVNKEERGTKGAALSTFISLAGCFLVLMPNNPSGGGISRRIEGEERDELKQVMNSLKIPHGMSVIVRTAGIGKSTEELQWDLDVLVKLWDSIKTASKQHGAPVLIHQESDIAIRAVRDHLRQNISEILVDDEEIYKKVYSYIERVRPDFLDRVKLYSDKIPLFSRFQLEKQIESAYQRNVRLPSGGEIVIDRTEALIAIDVNSAQSTKGGDIEETALNTNLEAADEIAKQLRIRDLAGLIVIDFIDMDRDENNYKVEDQMREALRSDRARVQLARLSRFGLLEMSRQRLRPTLSESSLIVCPRCHGEGSIRNVQSQAQSILHLIEENAQKKNITQVRVQLPIELATYMLNEQRHAINNIESTNYISIVIIANPYLQTPQYEIETLNVAGDKNKDTTELSYEMVSIPTIEYTPDQAEVNALPKRHAAVGDVLPDVPVPQPKPIKKPSALARFFKTLFEVKKTPATSQQTQHSRTPHRSTGSRYSKNQRTDRGSSRNQFRGRTRRTSDTGMKHREDHRTDSRRPMRSTMQQDIREDSQVRNSSDDRRSEQTTFDQSRQRQTHKSRSPRRRHSAPRNNDVATPSVSEKEFKQPHVVAPEQNIKRAPETLSAPAPRHIHTPSSIKKETDISFEQVETVHKAEILQSNIAQTAPERQHRQRNVKPVETIAPEEFEMVETKRGE